MLQRGTKEGVHIQGQTRPSGPHAPPRVSNDVHPGVGCGPDQPLCGLLGVLAQGHVGRGDDDVQFRQDLVGIIQGAIGENVHFRTVQDEDAVSPLSTHLFHFFPLFPQSFHTQAIGHMLGRGMVGDGDDPKASFPGGGHQVAKVQRTIAPAGMGVQIGFPRVPREKRGEGALARGFDFAPTLP